MQSTGSARVTGSTILGHEKTCFTCSLTGGTASVNAEDQQNDSMYLCPVTIGGQKMLLDFDSGSSDLWVMSTHLDPALQHQLKASGHNIYDPSKATPLPGSKWEIEYGDGSTASGNVVTDTVVIGTISVEDQAIECAKQLSEAFMENAGDGLLGLASGAINTVKPRQVHTPVENMISQRDIPSTAELFTAYLSSWKDDDEEDKGQSFYTFGNIDQTVMKRCGATDFWWTPLVNQSIRGFWEFASTTWTLNGKTTTCKAAQKGGNTAIADTGTTLSLVDDSVCDAICESIYHQLEVAHHADTPHRQIDQRQQIRLSEPRIRLSDQYA
jgi:hypothetical protein